MKLKLQIIWNTCTVHDQCSCVFRVGQCFFIFFVIWTFINNSLWNTPLYWTGQVPPIKLTLVNLDKIYRSWHGAEMRRLLWHWTDWNVLRYWGGWLSPQHWSFLDVARSSRWDITQNINDIWLQKSNDTSQNGICFSCAAICTDTSPCKQVYKKTQSRWPFFVPSFFGSWGCPCCTVCIVFYFRRTNQ